MQNTVQMLGGLDVRNRFTPIPNGELTRSYVKGDDC